MDVAVVETASFEAGGAAALVAFPGLGQVGTLAGSYLVDALRLKPVGYVDSDEFPPVAIVERGAVVQPVQVFAGGKVGARLVVVLSELPVAPEHIRPLVQAILGWAARKGIRRLAAVEGVSVEAEPAGSGPLDLWAISSEPAANRALRKAGVALAEAGVVAGVTGTLLSLAARHGVEVVGVMARAQGEEPSVHSASAVVELVAKLFSLPLDHHRLRRDVEAFDRHVVELARRRRLRGDPPPSPATDFV